ncbi:SPOR domain-containing protein [Colwellia piezophila]|uniref:SPOR domain-containing protein n=1 Tax=Colwellia piezophila TaxID=211668 RepID=UPI00037F07B0|nr:hypothetical protein [Colwellia piezophila]
MSALANSSSNLKKPQLFIENNLLQSSENSDVSVTTRIAYNLRFTKQAILIVASTNEQYTRLASDFLVSLSDTKLGGNAKQINVAFVSASEQLNDIQIRCRLIEQLFVNTLFDPEESLAVSILDLAKRHGDVVSIVIDHAHSLSLQVKYELSQLVNLAKKNNLTINVVLFGLTEAAHQLTINKSLFKNKMVVIDAETGQVLSLDDKKLVAQHRNISVTALQKFALLAATLILVAILIWGYQLIRYNVDAKPQNNAQASINLKNDSDTPLQKVSGLPSSTENVVRAMKKKEKPLNATNVANGAPVLAATSIEINNAILAFSIHSQDIVEPANSKDVLKALEFSENKFVAKPKFNNEGYEDQDKVTDLSDREGLIQENTADKIAFNKAVIFDPHFYYNQVIVHEQGYVIQVAGFSKPLVWQHFIKNNPNEILYSYQKKLNGQDFIVVTSRVYSNKTAAQIAIKLMPANLSKRRPWLKDISSVIKEINTFKG